MNTKSTILVVHDSPDMRTLLTALLTDQGHEVRSASSGEQALAAVAEKPPDLILLDIRMPGLDGFEICRRLKAQASSRDIPVIFISAVTRSAEKVGALDLGAADFVSKPIQGDELRARVHTHLELRRLRVQSEQQAADLQGANERLQALLKEAHHRVKNNLALIISLMRLEAGRSQVPETRRVLEQMQGRIQSVVLLNQTLYRTGSYARLNLADYLKQIATHLFQAQNAGTGEVQLLTELGPVEVETGQAIPCGLIVNELVTNSLKYAFADGRSGEVRIGLQQDPEGAVRLRVSDTGAGLPADFEARRGHSLGLHLVSDLAKQLQGTLEVGPGATFTVTFLPRPDPATVETLRPKS